MTISTIWKTETQVKTYQTDFLQQWKPAHFFQAMQEAAANHASHLGFDYRDMLANDKVWILSRMKIRFNKMPTVGQKVFIETWPKGIQQKVFFMRDFFFTGEDGQQFAAATSAWLLISPTARRMLLPHSLNGSLPDNNGRFALDETLDRISPAQDLEERLVVEARYSAVDMMGHVNNTRYIEWLCDCFSLEEMGQRGFSWLQINYVNEVRPGERVAISVGPKQPGAEVWVAHGNNLTSGVRAFEAEFAWAKGS